MEVVGVSGVSRAGELVGEMLSVRVEELSFGRVTKILRPLLHLRDDRSRIDGESGLYAGNTLVRDVLETLSVVVDCCEDGLLEKDVKLDRCDLLVEENGFGKSLDALSF